jgi:hypothetical protein
MSHSHRRLGGALGVLLSTTLVVGGAAAATDATAPSPATAGSAGSAGSASSARASAATLVADSPVADRGHSATAAARGSCDRPRNRMRCRVLARYIAWSSYLFLSGDPNPKARWTKRERRYLRHHPGLARKIGPVSIFRHPGKRGFRHKAKVRRDRRAGLALGGGPNYCTTLTISRLVESSIFQWDLFTARHKVRWCWDDRRVYDYNEASWTEIEVHDRSAVDVRGEIDSHEDALPTRGDWYTSQQYNICNCAFRIGTIAYWQPLWQVWASPGGKYRWKAHW